ncbi:MAG: dienelactone hydrolase family protein [Bradyrhizobium sp.]
MMIKTETIEYRDGGATLEGVLVHSDSARRKCPGVVVVPEWYGVGAYSIKRAQMLAELGYVAFVADVYGKGIRPNNPTDAAAEAGKYYGDRALLRSRGSAALDVLRNHQSCNAEKLAAIGYCFGGTAVLELARSGADVAGVVSFHGGLGTPTPARSIKSTVLVLHGADDPIVPAAEVLAFEQEMRDANVDWQLVSYGGAVHSFTNWELTTPNSTGVAYNEKADKRSWLAMQAFLAEIL